MSKIDEKRGAERFKLNQLIKLSFGKETFIQSEGIDISEKGLSCKTAEYLEPYTELYLLFSIPLENEMKEISGEGVVIWSEDKKDNYKIGIEFTYLNEDDFESLKTYLKNSK